MAAQVAFVVISTSSRPRWADAHEWYNRRRACNTARKGERCCDRRDLRIRNDPVLRAHDWQHHHGFSDRSENRSGEARSTFQEMVHLFPGSELHDSWDFKYFDFFAGSLVGMLGNLGLQDIPCRSFASFFLRGSRFISFRKSPISWMSIKDGLRLRDLSSNTACSSACSRT